MQSAELRERQRPLKDGYRSDPATALVAARAEGVVDVDAITCHVTTENGGEVAGLHRAAGGDGGQACSADLLLQALVACAGVTLASVATAMSVPVRSARVIADGHWDARGTLAVDRHVPVGMTDIAVRLEIDTDADAATVGRLVELTERYCVIAQTLVAPPRVTFAVATA